MTLGFRRLIGSESIAGPNISAVGVVYLDIDKGALFQIMFSTDRLRIPNPGEPAL